MLVTNQKEIVISIHTLVKRATQFVIQFDLKVHISIHALVKRATPIRRCTLRIKHISIHALVKRATYCKNNNINLQQISIHALVKRATNDYKYKPHHKRYFNPRPREEGDLPVGVMSTARRLFQSTPS